jgi:hypothetical protein
MVSCGLLDNHTTGTRRLAIWVHGYRPMHEIQVHIVQTQTFQALVQILLDSRVVGTPKLGRNEDIFSFDPTIERLLETFPDFVLIGIAVSCSD